MTQSTEQTMPGWADPKWAGHSHSWPSIDDLESSEAAVVECAECGLPMALADVLHSLRDQEADDVGGD